MISRTVLCDSCENAFISEGFPIDERNGVILLMQAAIDIGRDIPDHICDSVERADLDCICACRED